MVWIRSLIFTIGQWIFTVIFCSLGLLTFPFKPHTRYRFLSQWARCMLWWLRVICGLSFKVTGAENIPATPSIILCKHQSAWETLALQVIFPPQVWVLKRELLWLPFFGWCLALTSPIAMVIRLPFGVPMWQLALSIFLLILGFIGTVWLAARIYRVGILMYGKKVTYKELGKWMFYKG